MLNALSIMVGNGGFETGMADLNYLKADLNYLKADLNYLKADL